MYFLKCSLEVREENKGAVKLYKKKGSVGPSDKTLTFTLIKIRTLTDS